MSWVSKQTSRAKKSVSKTLKKIEQVAKKPSTLFEDPQTALEIYGVSSGMGSTGAAGGMAGASEARDINRRLAGDAPDLESSTNPPTSESEEVEAAARAQRRKYGRAATLLTGGAGLTTLAPTVRRTLTGA